MDDGDVRLRAAVDGDRAARRALGVRADISRLFGAEAPADRAMTPAEAERWFERLGADGVIEWIVDFRGRFVGTARLHTIDPDAGTAYYAIGLLDPTVLGRGIGRVVTRLVCEHAFTVLALREVRLRVLDFNGRARRCYEAVGFVEIGRAPSGIVDRGRSADDVVMVLSHKGLDEHRGQPPRTRG
jgi:RimJ/RimL family protein N-acetyltransferase